FLSSFMFSTHTSPPDIFALSLHDALPILLFVSVYLTEFSIRWLVAIARRTHERWFYFPFVHWYDLLGCIPVGSFRWLQPSRSYQDRKSTRLNSSHVKISYAVLCLKKKTKK